MSHMKHHRLISLLAACLALCACQPDTDHADGLVLHIEGSAATGAKPSVDGINTTWLNGDLVSINGAERTVSVSGSTATLPDVTAPNSGEHYFAFSPASLCPQADPNVSYADPGFWWEHHLVGGSAFRFSYPREYQYEVSSRRQNLASPMVAVAAHDASSLTFRHLAAALQVEIENPMNVSIYIDSVVVEAASACLNGDASFTIAPSTSEPSTFEPSITAPSAASPTFEQRSVCLSLVSSSQTPGYIIGPDGTLSSSTGTSIRSGRTLAVQIPLPPLPQGEQLTVRVFGKTANPMGNYYPLVGRQGSGNVNTGKFTFQHHAQLTADLGRTALIRARAAIRPDGHLLDEEGSISRLSVFSLADDKQVLFYRDPTSNGNYQPSMAEVDSLITSTARAEARFLVLEYNNTILRRRYLIIFPDGTTMAGARSGLGIDSSQVPDDKFNNHNGPNSAPSHLYHESMIQNTCNTHGYLLLLTGGNDYMNYYLLSDGCMTPSGITHTVDLIPTPYHGNLMTYNRLNFRAFGLIGTGSSLPSPF